MTRYPTTIVVGENMIKSCVFGPYIVVFGYDRDNHWLTVPSIRNVNRAFTDYYPCDKPVRFGTLDPFLDNLEGMAFRFGYNGLSFCTIVNKFLPEKLERRGYVPTSEDALTRALFPTYVLHLGNVRKLSWRQTFAETVIEKALADKLEAA